MAKVKSSNSSAILSILKCVLLALVITLVGIVILAIILKFRDLSTTFINTINNIIKGLAIFFMVTCVKRTSGEKLLAKAVVAGVLYSVLSFIIFSILNGGFTFNLSVLYDLLFAIITAIIASIILNLLTKRVG